MVTAGPDLLVVWDEDKASDGGAIDGGFEYLLWLRFLGIAIEVNKIYLDCSQKTSLRD